MHIYVCIYFIYICVIYSRYNKYLDVIKIRRVFRVLGNLPYEKSAHIPSAGEGSRDFLIFRPEDSNSFSIITFTQ